MDRHKIKIRAGSTEFDNGGVLTDGFLSIIPTEYTPETYDHDVGLIFLKKSLPLNGRTIRSIKLIEPGTIIQKGEQGKVVGWGFLKVNGILFIIYGIQ